MARPAGARNVQFDQRRNALISKAQERLALQTGEPPSFRELALAAGVSVATLRHYFGTREALIKSVFAHHVKAGERHLQRTREIDDAEIDLESSLKDFLTRIVRGWTEGVIGSLHRIGLAEGLRQCSSPPSKPSRPDSRPTFPEARSSRATCAMPPSCCSRRYCSPCCTSTISRVLAVVRSRCRR